MKKVYINEAMRFMVECLCKVGTTPANAEDVASVMVFSDRRGIAYYGLDRLKKYLCDIRSGRCDPNAEPEKVSCAPSVATMDGKNGLGPIVGNECMKIAMEKAEVNGVGWVVVKNSNDFGPAAWYSMQALDRHMLGFACCNGFPLVCPTNSQKAALGTNPISFAAPSKDDDSFTLDMSTATTSEARLHDKQKEKKRYPEGWVIGNDDKYETLSSSEFRCLLPLGGHEETSGNKGYGLALMVEVLTSVSSGGKLPSQLEPTNEESHKRAGISQCFFAVNTSCLAEGFYERIDTLLRDMRSLPPDPNKKVIAPGDRERCRSEILCEYLKYDKDQLMVANVIAEELEVKRMESSDL